MTAERLASDDTAGGAAEAPFGADCWVFDVDGCLVDSLTGSSLRPGARELLEHLARRGLRVVWWSAGGDTYAQARAQQFGLDHLVDSFGDKDGRDGNGHYRTARLDLHSGRAVFVDDRPEDLAPSLDVIPVSPYLSDDPFDRGLKDVARRAGVGWPTSPGHQ
jgi:hypothetical protein